VYPIRYAAAIALAAVIAAPGFGGTLAISGTRGNITPGGVFGGRCAPAITVSFAPDLFAASGTSTRGDFSYTASHCIAAPPPGAYYDGEFEWTLGDGTLVGTHHGTLSATDTAGQFDILEWLTFTGGTGRYAGATGSATYTGLLTLGMVEGMPGSWATGTFAGTLAAPGIPEPGVWGLLIAGLGAIGAASRRRRALA
jgi:hypothetical protein